MKRHILSLILCGIYCAATAASLLYAYFSAGDPKGHFVLLQLPLAPIAALIQSMGLGHLIRGLGWASAYAVLFPLTLALLYGLGWLPVKAGQLIHQALVRAHNRPH